MQNKKFGEKEFKEMCLKANQKAVLKAVTNWNAD